MGLEVLVGEASTRRVKQRDNVNVSQELATGLGCRPGGGVLADGRGVVTNALLEKQYGKILCSQTDLLVFLGTKIYVSANNNESHK